MIFRNCTCFFKSFEIAYIKLVGQNILEKCCTKFFFKIMHSSNSNILHLVEGVSLNLETYGFPRNRPFRIKVKSHLSRRHYSGNLPSGQKTGKDKFVMLFPHYKIAYQKSCTLDACTFGLWTLGVWTTGRLDFRQLHPSNLDAWTLK